ncbi:hypothetical protein K2173_011482 [Erythroxylum novogranatense]|uniref:Transmembrane protein n=1 Tax=Erythroxylum novogranatense TaxID=1862640 RepID=A0AAV8S687_9ROSI|nr:hypothetical protein K2173_011482 [Erythroxylum novogranatense]
MASLLSPSCNFIPSFCRHKELKYPHVRSQSFKEDGPPAHIVDANLGALRKRIAEVYMKERLDASRRLKNIGWNYHSCDHNNNKHNRHDDLLSESLKLLGFVCTALGLVFFTGSLSIYFAYLLVHLGSK